MKVQVFDVNERLLDLAALWPSLPISLTVTDRTGMAGTRHGVHFTGEQTAKVGPTPLARGAAVPLVVALAVITLLVALPLRRAVRR